MSILTKSSIFSDAGFSLLFCSSICLQQRRVEERRREMNWVQRKIYLYNVTFGLYMLDWWERYLFNTLMIVLMWFIFYNSSRYVTDFCRRHVW